MAPSNSSVVNVEEDLRVEISGVRYTLIPTTENYLADLAAGVEGFVPVFIYRVTPGDCIKESTLLDYFRMCDEIDDVFDAEFLNHIVFYGSDAEDLTIDSDAFKLLDGLGNGTFIPNEKSKPVPPPGPYIVGRGITWQPWRIYLDTHATLTSSLRPTIGGTRNLIEYNLLGEGSVRAVVVPSRCYSQSDDHKPLSGVRIVVSNIYDIAGTSTTLCNRAWSSFHSPSCSTAPAVQTLIDKGVVVIGKAKLNAFHLPEGKIDNVEYLAPFNPRGDGYQTIAGISSGSCAAVAAYNWIDFAVGSDTNGCWKKPAHGSGVFGIRATERALNTSGITSFSPTLDAPALFGRDIALLFAFVRAWYGNSSLLDISAGKIDTILYPKDCLPVENSAQNDLIEAFIQGLEIELGVPRTNISLAHEWNKYRPAEAKEDDIEDYLKGAVAEMYYLESYDRHMDFRNKYEERFGKRPFIQSAVRWRWRVAEMTDEMRRRDIDRRLHVYKKWIQQYMFRILNRGRVIVVLPIGKTEP